MMELLELADDRGLAQRERIDELSLNVEAESECLLLENRSLLDNKRLEAENSREPTGGSDTIFDFGDENR
jgi:hypothetical protein